MSKIDHLHARMISDTKGYPTVEVDAVLENGFVATAAVASGASTGIREAKELRDGDKNRFFGKGVDNAVNNVNRILSDSLAGMDPADQERIDRKMIDLDGTENKERLGANAILGVSLAVARVAACDQHIPLYEHFRRIFGNPNATVELPVPMLNVVNGGVHARNSLDFQAFMIIPLGAPTFSEAIRMASEVFHSIRAVFLAKNNIGEHVIATGDEGGWAPVLQSSEEAIEIIMEAINVARYKPGEDVAIGLDPAASQFYEDGRYVLAERAGDMTAEDMVDLYSRLVNDYPIISIEDGLAEGDWDGWKLLTERLGDRVQLVGDDLFVTNVRYLRRGIQERVANAVQIMPNQVGTLTEALETMRLATEAGYAIVVSHRSGETLDTTISDLCVGCNVPQIKAGGLSGIERVEKYNRILRIEEELGTKGSFKGRHAFERLDKNERSSHKSL